MKKKFLLMTMMLAVGLGGYGCGLSGGSEFETITDGCFEGLRIET